MNRLETWDTEEKADRNKFGEFPYKGKARWKRGDLVILCHQIGKSFWGQSNNIDIARVTDKRDSRRDCEKQFSVKWILFS